MTAFLTDNLPLLAGAPNGIQKLRELILELAVRGKLVPQDPSDEPASELLKRIAEEKACLIAEGKIKKQKSLPEVDEEEKPHALPLSWKWVRFDVISNTRLGKMLDKAKNKGELRPYLRNTNVQWFNFEIDDLKSMRFEEHELDEYRVNSGDLVICEGGEPGRCAVWQGGAEDMFIQKALHRARPWLGVSPFFLQFCLKAAAHSGFLDQFFTGATIKHFSGEKLAKYPVPLPPIAEQHRIVAKVDELMALCDRLEAQQADAESAHAQLVQALLDSLPQATDAADFTASWQRLAEHFHTLFTTEPSIDALKQTLLQLAVMGKLVPQYSSDEPAGELLKRIAEEKARLVVEGKIKKQKPLADIGEFEMSFELPTGWKWRRFADFALDVSTGPFGSLIHQSDYVNGGVPLVNPSHMIDGRIVADNSVSLPVEMAASLDSYRLSAGDMVMARRGEVGRAALVTEAEEGWLCGTGSFALRFTQEVSRAYIWILFRCNSVRTYLAGAAVGTTMVNLNHSILLKMPIAVPPTAEQHRIVAKADQLMALCDQLKARLNQARQVHEQLANALVENALNADRQQTPAITDRKATRALLAAEITHQLHGLKTFGQRKLQKVIHLAEHAARLAAIQGNYLRDAAGPHDRQLMDQVEGELHNRQWYERIERDTVGHAYRPLAGAGQHRPEYENTWSATERATIQQVIDLMRGWDTNRCERVVTLYAAWNDFLLEGKSVTDGMLVHEVMYSWNDTKLRFTEDEWRAELDEMKKQKLLIPSGFGKRTQGGLQTLPGLD